MVLELYHQGAEQDGFRLAHVACTHYRSQLISSSSTLSLNRTALLSCRYPLSRFLNELSANIRFHNWDHGGKKVKEEAAPFIQFFHAEHWKWQTRCLMMGEQGTRFLDCGRCRARDSVFPLQSSHMLAR